MFRLSCLFITSLLFVGCQTAKKVEKQNFNYSISLYKEFTIELPSNPSTGYKWRWAKTPSNTIIEKTNDSFTNSSQTNKTGVGGIQKITFKGVKRGIDKIKLEYIRPWERGAPAAKTVIYTVEIH